MRMHKRFLIGSLLLGLSAGGAVALEQTRIAQADPGTSLQRQRAPGIPLAPSPGTVAERERALGDTAQPSPPARPRNVRQASNPSQIERDPPMPRGVPSIIAP